MRPFLLQYYKAVIFIGCVALLAACYYRYARSRGRVELVLANLCGCQQLAADIRLARTKPQQASLKPTGNEDFGSLIERAASDSSITRDKVLRIDPQAPKRIGKTEYLERSTEVEMVGVTLRQLVELIFHIRNAEDGLQVQTLRMREPHSATTTPGPECWLADIVLTQHIYAPTTPRR